MDNDRFEREVGSLIVGYMSDCNEYPEEDELLGYVLDCLCPATEEQREIARSIVRRHA